MELLDSTEKLVEAQSQNTKLQTFLDNVMKEKVQKHVCVLAVFCVPFWLFQGF